MEQLVLLRCGWTGRPIGEVYALRHPPVPQILQYWCTGYAGDGSYDNYVGIIAVPPGVDPMTVVRQDFFDVRDRGMTRPYVYGENESDRFHTSLLDWSGQRQAYFAATGQVYTRPVIGHYESPPNGDTWWCTTITEIFDV